jgi:hypothetical protein
MIGISEAEKEQRCLQIKRTVASEALQNQQPSLWTFPDPNAEAPPADPKAAAKGAPPPEQPADALEVADDPETGGLFLSHVWGEPEWWTELFGSTQFKVTKHQQVSSALQCASSHHPSRPELIPPQKETRVWVDRTSLPDPVVPFDHPFEELTLGTYAMPVKDLKNMFPKPEYHIDAEGYTMVRIPDGGFRFEATMNLRKWDEIGRPLERTTPMPVEWDIPPGVYHVRSAKVIPEDRVSPSEAGEKTEFKPFREHLRKWCANLRLRDEVWVEFTLGSIRAECMLLAETMLALHGGLLAVVTWNYFDRLWPFVEWTVYSARRGPDRIQLAADHFTGAALVEYHRAIRRLSVDKAGVRDTRDRELLLGMLRRIFKCDTTLTTDGFVKPDPRKLTEANKVPITDYSAVERYARVTAIAVFAHEACEVANRKPTAGDEFGWAALAGELGSLALEAALKKWKPLDWDELAATKQQEKAERYDLLVEDWWTGKMLPVLEEERKLAMR